MVSLAVISDIHGNSWALQAVLADIRSRGITTIINLGDILYGPLDPVGTFELLKKYDVYSISGNQDRFIIENLQRATKIPTLEYVKQKISNEIEEWLLSLPFDYHFNTTVYCCHGTPQCDSTYLLENIEEEYISIKGERELETHLKEIVQQYVFCGHSHVPRVIETKNKTIVNPGSVGLPAYDDELPLPHKMETFSPRARYAVLRVEGDNFNVDTIAVDYPYEIAAQAASENNREDWAEWIRTGRVNGK